MTKGTKITLGVLGGLLLFVFILFRIFVGGYNTLVTLDENTQSTWAQVENLLKRRSDLIPNLVNTVKGYAKHEKEIFVQIAESRSKLAGSKSVKDTMAASQQMESALSRLLVVMERYPDLKANSNFNRLMDELSGTENRIAVERRRYNEAVKSYKMYAKRFPGRLYASIFGFEAKQYFEVSEAEKTLPTVEF